MRDGEPRRTLAVGAVGWLTLLFAVAYAVAAGVLLFVVSAITAEETPAKPTGWEGLAVIVTAVAAVLGVLFAIHAALGLTAGVGVVLRRGWGRILTFVVAPFAILWGVAFIAALRDDPLYLAIGLSQIAYGLFAILVLATNGDEFRERTRRGRSGRDRHAEPAFVDEPR